LLAKDTTAATQAERGNAMKVLMRAGLLAALASWLLPAHAQESADTDKAAFNNHCRTCHSPREGDNRLGPSLGKIVGTKAGSRPDYPNYSAAMKSSARSVHCRSRLRSAQQQHETFQGRH
jgi:cytochrome c